MNIRELIEKLEQIEEKEGNIQVSIQYRDRDGEYDGEEEPMFEVREDEEYCIMSHETVNHLRKWHIGHFSGKRIVL